MNTCPNCGFASELSPRGKRELEDTIAEQARAIKSFIEAMEYYAKRADQLSLALQAEQRKVQALEQKCEQLEDSSRILTSMYEGLASKMQGARELLEFRTR